MGKSKEKKAIKPTENEMMIAADIVEQLIAYLEESEPYAVNSIKALEEALEELC